MTLMVPLTFPLLPPVPAMKKVTRYETKIREASRVQGQSPSEYAIKSILSILR